MDACSTKRGGKHDGFMRYDLRLADTAAQDGHLAYEPRKVLLQDLALLCNYSSERLWNRWALCLGRSSH